MGDDLDPYLIQCIGYMYASKNLRKGDYVPLQHMLEQAIKEETNVVKDFYDTFQSCLPPKNTKNNAKLVSTSAELEYDLLIKDGIACVVCNKINITVDNRLLECTKCHSMYHQECHVPIVVVAITTNEKEEEDNKNNSDWLCNACSDCASGSKVVEKVPCSISIEKLDDNIIENVVPEVLKKYKKSVVNSSKENAAAGVKKGDDSAGSKSADKVAAKNEVKKNPAVKKSGANPEEIKTDANNGEGNRITRSRHKLSQEDEQRTKSKSRRRHLPRNKSKSNESNKKKSMR